MCLYFIPSRNLHIQVCKKKLDPVKGRARFVDHSRYRVFASSDERMPPMTTPSTTTGSTASAARSFGPHLASSAGHSTSPRFRAARSGSDGRASRLLSTPLARLGRHHPPNQVEAKKWRATFPFLARILSNEKRHDLSRKSSSQVQYSKRVKTGHVWPVVRWRSPREPPMLQVVK
jgi:hypothetical protein